MGIYTVFNVVIVVILGLVARFADKKVVDRERGGYSTRNLVVAAVLAAIAGVINTGMGNLWYLANTSLGPLGGALIQGMFMWAYILAVFMVRKPGVALAFGVIEAATEVLLGNAAGIGTLGWGISQGLAIEIIILLCAYSRFGLLTAIMAGMASSQFGTLWSSLFYGWDPAYSRDVWIAVPINMVSGAVFSGALGYFLATKVAKTGLVRSAE
ncbi:MAG: ECF transporter S component [Spirochaetales bacterium]|nr:ECF transporter S component [Spirochaetales bacterium]